MKLIQLGKGNYSVKVDDEDYDKLSKYNWQLSNKRAANKYAVRDIYPNSKRTTVRMHRIIMNLTDLKLVVDHIDGDGLNNQKSNLRIATPGQNCANRQPSINRNYLGVSPPTTNCKLWRARCKQQVIQARTEVEAALLYNEMAIKTHGEFARLNVVTEKDKKKSDEYINALPIIIPDTETHKTCKKCNEHKERKMYNNQKNSKDGKQPICKQCCNKYQKYKREKIGEKIYRICKLT